MVWNKLIIGGLIFEVNINRDWNCPLGKLWVWGSSKVTSHPSRYCKLLACRWREWWLKTERGRGTRGRVCDGTCFILILHTNNKQKFSLKKKKTLSLCSVCLLVALLYCISCCNPPDHQGASADVPPNEGLPIMRGTEGPVLWLVCPGGQVRAMHAHLIHAPGDKAAQTPTLALPSVKHSGVFVQCFIADTLGTPWCLYSISCCPCSRKELKLFVSLMQRRQPVQFTLISLYLSGSGGERKRYVSCTLLRFDHERREREKQLCHPRRCSFPLFRLASSFFLSNYLIIWLVNWQRINHFNDHLTFKLNIWWQQLLKCDVWVVFLSENVCFGTCSSDKTTLFSPVFCCLVDKRNNPPIKKKLSDWAIKNNH